MRFTSRSARQLALAAGLLGFASLTACNKDSGEFAKTKSGIEYKICLLYTSPSPRDRQKSRMPSSA